MSFLCTYLNRNVRCSRSRAPGNVFNGFFCERGRWTRLDDFCTTYMLSRAPQQERQAIANPFRVVIPICTLFSVTNLGGTVLVLATFKRYREATKSFRFPSKHVTQCLIVLQTMHLLLAAAITPISLEVHHIHRLRLHT